jgi:hypothetical protein
MLQDENLPEIHFWYALSLIKGLLAARSEELVRNLSSACDSSEEVVIVIFSFIHFAVLGYK